MLIAMEKVDGEAVDAWLYGVKDAEFKTCDVARFEDHSRPFHGKHRTSQFPQAVLNVTEFFNQVSPTFAGLGGICLHRDISAHNILVDDRDGILKFTVIDFGLAVDSKKWRQGWRTEGVGGDARYWSPAHWQMIAYGPKYVEASGGNAALYSTRLDHYAIGILGLEMLMGLTEHRDAQSWPGLAELRRAWGAYWRAVMTIFQKMWSPGGFGTLRETVKQQRFDCLLQHLLADVQRALQAMAHSVKAHRPVSALLLVLRDLTMPEGMSWTEVHSMCSASSVVPTATKSGTSSSTPSTGQARAFATSSSAPKSKARPSEVFVPNSAPARRPSLCTVGVATCSRISQVQVPLIPSVATASRTSLSSAASSPPSSAARQCPAFPKGNASAPSTAVRVVRPPTCVRTKQAQVSSTTTVGGSSRTSLSTTSTPPAPSVQAARPVAGAKTCQYPTLPTSNASAPRTPFRIVRSPACATSIRPQISSAFPAPSNLAPRISVVRATRPPAGLIASFAQLHCKQSSKVAFRATEIHQYVRMGTSRPFARRW